MVNQEGILDLFGSPDLQVVKKVVSTESKNFVKSQVEAAENDPNAFLQFLVSDNIPKEPSAIKKA